MSLNPLFSVQTKRRYRLSHGPIVCLSDETSQSREVHRVPRGSHLVHHAGGGSARETRARVSSAQLSFQGFPCFFFPTFWECRILSMSDRD